MVELICAQTGKILSADDEIKSSKQSNLFYITEDMKLYYNLRECIEKEQTDDKFKVYKVSPVDKQLFLESDPDSLYQNESLKQIYDYINQSLKPNSFVNIKKLLNYENFISQLIEFVNDENRVSNVINELKATRVETDYCKSLFQYLNVNEENLKEHIANAVKWLNDRMNDSNEIHNGIKSLKDDFVSLNEPAPYMAYKKMNSDSKCTSYENEYLFLKNVVNYENKILSTINSSHIESVDFVITLLNLRDLYNGCLSELSQRKKFMDEISNTIDSFKNSTTNEYNRRKQFTKDISSFSVELIDKLLFESLFPSLNVNIDERMNDFNELYSSLLNFLNEEQQIPRIEKEDISDAQWMVMSKTLLKTNVGKKNKTFGNDSNVNFETSSNKKKNIPPVKYDYESDGESYNDDLECQASEVLSKSLRINSESKRISSLVDNHLIEDNHFVSSANKNEEEEEAEKVLNEQIKKLESLNSEQEEIIDSLKKKNKHIEDSNKSELKELQTKIVTKESQIKELQNKLTENEKKIKEVKESLELGNTQFSKKIEILETKNLKMEQKYISKMELLTKERDSLKKDLVESKNSLSEVQTRCSTLEKAMKEKNQKLIITEENNSKLKKEKDDQIVSNDKKIRLFKDKVNNLEEDKLTLEKEKDELKKSVNFHQQLVKQKENTISNLSKNIKKLETDIKKFKNSNDEQKKEIENLKDENVQLSTKVNETSTFSQQKGVIEGLEKKIEELNDEVKKLKDSDDKQKKTFKKLSEENKKLIKETTESKKLIDKKESIIAASEKKIKKLEDSNGKQMEEIEKLKDDIENLTNEITASVVPSKPVATSNENVQEMKNKLEKLTKRLTEYKKYTDDLKKKLEKVKPKEVKLTVKEFAVDDDVLLYKKGENFWQLFTTAKEYENYFLSPDIAEELKKRHSDLTFAKSKIVFIDYYVASPTNNPYSLQLNTPFHVVHVKI